MTDLIAELQRQIDRKSDVRLLDAVATGTNTVVVGGSTVAVTLPAIIPVVAGDFCQVLEQGASRVIIGPVGPTPWQDVTVVPGYSATRPLQWRREGGRVHLRGRLLRTGATTGTGTLIFGFVEAGGWDGNPNVPTQTAEFPCYRLAAGHVVDGGWVADAISGSFLSSGVTTITNGDYLYFDHISWPVA